MFEKLRSPFRSARVTDKRREDARFCFSHQTHEQLMLDDCALCSKHRYCAQTTAYAQIYKIKVYSIEQLNFYVNDLNACSFLFSKAPRSHQCHSNARAVARVICAIAVKIYLSDGVFLSFFLRNLSDM